MPFRSLFIVVTAAAVGLGGCSDAFSPPEGTVRLDPPAVYRDLWLDVEACSGLSGRFDLVRWYVVPGTAQFPCPGGSCRGLWEAPHNIYLNEADAEDLFGDNYLTVRHEILHDLVRKSGHPPVFSQCKLLRERTDY